ncbi:MAG: diguanylate cyclase [Pseudomonadota bacterium]
MALSLRLLIVDDSTGETEKLVTLLKNGGYDIHHKRVETAAELEIALNESRWEMIISEYIMPRFSGLAALRMVRSKGPDIPFIILTEIVDESTGMEAIKAGATDFIDKRQAERLMGAIERELEKRHHPDTAERHPRQSSAAPVPKPWMGTLSARLSTGFSCFVLLILSLWGIAAWQTPAGGNAVMTAVLHVLVLAISAVIFFALFRSVINSINRLQHSGNLLIEGDLDTPVPSVNTSELDELAQTLDFLRRELHKSIENHKMAVDERRRVENALQQVHFKLTRQMEVISCRAHELSLLSKLSGMLQTCKEYDEAYDAIYLLLPKLLPARVGGLYILNETTETMDPVALWGETVTGAGAFETDDCYALRKGQVYRVNHPGAELICRHVKNLQPDTTSICIPMIAQGRISGLLHIQDKQPLADSPTEMADAGFHLAVTAAEQLSLSLANLKLQSALRQQSIQDTLTGLFNRRYLDESLAREIARARRAGATVGIIMIDIDYFKRFNDTYGHDAGDTVLQSVGKFISLHVREGDIACRYGGEEFTLIMPGASLESAFARAEELRKGVQSLQMSHAGKPLESITLSLGVAAFPQDGETGELVIQAADAALYRAKDNGRNRAEKASGIKASAP